MNVVNMINLNEYGEQFDGGMGAHIERITIFDAEQRFQDAMAEAGLGRPDIEADGRIHRFVLPGEKPGKKDGWFVLYPGDPCPAGAFGNWKEDFSQTWHARGADYNLTAEEQEQIRRKHRQAKIQRDEQRRKEAIAAANSLYVLYQKLPEATPQNAPYLSKKQVGAFGGVRAIKSSGVLCVPMLDGEFRFAGMQFIAPKKPEAGTDKKFGTGVDPKGLFNIVAGDNATVYICEGYATGASIHMATGNTVVLAFTAGNLMAVAKTIKEAGTYNTSRLIIAADDDQWNKPLANGTPNNVGQAKAKEACAKLGLSMVSPVFGDLSSRPTDFNDLHVLEGIDAVRLQITSKNTGPKLSEWDSMTAFSGEPPMREWLVRGVFPRGQVSLIAAAGGIGKSYMLLSMGRDVSNTSLIRAEHFGGSLELTGSTVYLSAEDDHIEIHNRISSLGGPTRGLYAVPLPNAGGAKPYFQAIDRQFLTTDHWAALVAQLRTIRNLTTLIIDPIQPLCAMDLNMPEAAQAVCSFLADLAADLNISVIIAHHFRKSTVVNAEDARNAIRGTAGLVDGVRSVYALWQAPELDTKKICKKLGMPYKDDAVVFGCVVKGNGQKLTGVRKFARTPHGALTDHTGQLRDCVDDNVLLNALKNVVAEAAEDGKPYTKTGANGVFERRAELPEPLCLLPKRKLWELVEALTSTQDVRTCSARGSKVVKWLDITTGPFAMGDGEFAPGFFESSQRAVE